MNIFYFLLLLAIAIIFIWFTRRNLTKIKIVIRFTIVFSILMALFAPQWSTPTNKKMNIFLLDISQSMLYPHDAYNINLHQMYRREVLKIQKQLTSQDQLAVIYFAKDIEIAIPPTSAASKLHFPKPTIDLDGTNIKNAFEQALAMCLPDYQCKFIVYTDTKMTNDRQQQLYNLISPYKISIKWQIGFFDKAKKFQDAAISSFYLPYFAANDEWLQGHLNINTTHPGKFTITIKSEDKLLYQRSFFAPNKGLLQINFAFKGKWQNRQKIIAELTPHSFIDNCPDNNSYQHFIKPYSLANILAIGKIAFAPLQNCTITEKTTAQVLKKIPDFNDFEVVAIADGKAPTLAPLFPALKKYVIEGGSLIMLGNDNTFGQGGYAGTQIEEVLPLWCTPKEKKALAFTVVMDSSGSMASPSDQSPASITKMQEAQKALKNLVLQMSEQDLFALISFNDTYREVLPLLPLYQHKKENSLKKLANIYPLGKTHIAPALKKALDITQKTSYKKHIVLISDGLSLQERPMLLSLVKDIVKKNIILSVICTGDDSDLLRDMVTFSKGKYYNTKKQSLFSLLLRTISWAKSSKIAQQGKLVATQNKILAHTLDSYSGIKINKYSITSIKNWGKLLLIAQQKPILAIGYYGAGKTAALTTNIFAKWGNELYSQKGLKLLSEIISWLIPVYRSDFIISPQIAPGKLQILVQDLTKYPKARKLQIRTSWKNTVYKLYQTKIYQYETSIPLPNQGTYNISLNEITINGERQKQYITYTIPYSREYIWQNIENISLQRNIPPASSKQPLTWLFIVIALILFVIERNY